MPAARRPRRLLPGPPSALRLNLQPLLLGGGGAPLGWSSGCRRVQHCILLWPAHRRHRFGSRQGRVLRRASPPTAADEDPARPRRLRQLHGRSVSTRTPRQEAPSSAATPTSCAHAASGSPSDGRPASSAELERRGICSGHRGRDVRDEVQTEHARERAHCTSAGPGMQARRGWCSTRPGRPCRRAGRHPPPRAGDASRLDVPASIRWRVADAEVLTVKRGDP